MAPAEEIRRQSNQHAEPGCAKAPVPAHLFTECANDQGRYQRSDIQREQIQTKCAGAALIVGRIEKADLRRHVAKETARADDEQRESYEKESLRCHGQMSCRHQQGSDGDRLCLADDTIAQPCTDQGRRIDQT